MVQQMSDILQHIADSLEPEDLVERLGISAEDLAERAGVSIKRLTILYKEEIEENLDMFHDVHREV